MAAEELTKENLRVFGFTDAETQTFISLLESGPMSVSKLSRVSGIPRTTVDDVLERLHARGFVRKLPRSYRSVWRVKNIEKLRSLMRETLSHIATEGSAPEERQDADADASRTAGLTGDVDAADIGIHVFRGTRQLARVYDHLLSHIKPGKGYILQGNRGAEASLWHFQDRYLQEFHVKLTERGVDLEIMNGEGVFELFSRITPALLRSHASHFGATTLLPGEFMDFEIALVVLESAVIITHLEQETVITVQYQPLVQALNGLCGALHGTGRKEDLGAYIQNLIAQREQGQ